MKAQRLPKGFAKQYNSFEELAKDWGIKIKRKQTKDKEKLERQRNDFCSKHICSACKQPMTWIGGNIMFCQNPQCKGIEHKQVTDSGETRVWYSPSFDLLDNKGSEIAKNIFTEYED